MFQVAFDHFYHPGAPDDKCTMFCDRNLINRRNVVTDVKKKFGACQEFFLMEVEARVVAATLSVLALDSLDGEPTEEVLPSSLKYSSEKTIKTFVTDLSLKVVDKLILNKENMDRIMNEKENEKELDVGILPDGKFPCRFSGCKKLFAHDGKRREAHERTHGLHQEKHGQTSNETKCLDDMLNYQYSLLEYGLLYKNFCDAISEGDGARLVRCWKYFLLVLKQDKEHSRKYALEGFNLLCQIYALLSPRDAHRLIWNRSVKAKFGSGNNIPLDLALEHYNRVLKEVIKKMGPNATNEKAVNRFCKAIPINKQIMDNFDNECQVLKRSGQHVVANASCDFNKVVDELIRSEAFTKKPERKYKGFSNCEASILANFDIHSMYKWINEHKCSECTKQPVDKYLALVKSDCLVLAAKLMA